MTDSRLTAEAVAFAIARVVAKDSERPFNFMDVCDHLYGSDFCTGRRAERIIHFMRRAVGSGHLELDNAEGQGNMKDAQHYRLSYTPFADSMKTGLASMDKREVLS